MLIYLGGDHWKQEEFLPYVAYCWAASWPSAQRPRPKDISRRETPGQAESAT